jgi:predicted Zn-ribbon and HTH transcriptional regulator
MIKNYIYKIKCKKCNFEKNDKLPFFGEKVNNEYIFKCPICKENINEQLRLEIKTKKILKKLPLLPDMSKMKIR